MIAALPRTLAMAVDVNPDLGAPAEQLIRLANIDRGSQYNDDEECLTLSSFTAGCSALWYEPCGSAKIAIDFCGLLSRWRKRSWSWCYRSVNTHCQANIYRSRQYDNDDKGCVIVIYRILYANSTSTTQFSRIKCTSTNVPNVFRRFLVPELLPRPVGTENRLTTTLYALIFAT